MALQDSSKSSFFQRLDPVRIPFLIKLGIVFAVLLGSVLFVIFLFVQNAPNATTRTYNTTSSLKPNFYKIKGSDRKISFQIINKGKRFNSSRTTLFFLGSFPFSRHFTHPMELEICKEHDIQLVRLDLPGFGLSTVNTPSDVYASSPKYSGGSNSVFSREFVWGRFHRTVKDLKNFIRSLKIESDNYGFVGFGMGSPYTKAISTTQPISLISPVAHSSWADREMEIGGDFRALFGSKMRSRPLITEFLIRMYSKLGFLCEKSSFLSLLKKWKFLDVRDYDFFNVDEIRQRVDAFERKRKKEEEESEAEAEEKDINDILEDEILYYEQQHEESAEIEAEEIEELVLTEDEEVKMMWNDVFTDSFVGMFRKGIDSMMSEIMLFFTEDPVVRSKNSKDDSTSSSSSVRVFSGGNDVLFVEENFGHLEESCFERNEDSHYETFRTYFEEAVKYVVQEIRK